MDLRQNIYNDLISDTFEHNTSKSKKDIFIENIPYVKKLLLSGLSTKKQIERYSDDIDEISRSCYEKYSKEFLNEIYEEGVIKSLFHRNIKTIAYYLTNEENPKSTKLYDNLLTSGSLKLAKNKKDSSLDYKTFSTLLKDFLEAKGHENLITFDEKIDYPYEENSSDIEVNIETIQEEDKEVDIQLIDDTSKRCEVSFLKSNFVEYDNSYIDNNIKEKNVYYIQTKYIDKEYHFEKFKDVIRKHKIVEDYSIVLHNNSIVDMKLYIYRYVNNDLVLIKSVNAESSIFELDQLVRRARDNFFTKFESHMNYIINA